MTAGANRET